jgi:ATP/maltotriose-dependent transcriptional regulator MalT
MRKQSSQRILITTKLSSPAMKGSRWVLHTLLISRLEEDLEKWGTLISAPAGYSKPTLAVQWIDQGR